MKQIEIEKVRKIQGKRDRDEREEEAGKVGKRQAEKKNERAQDKSCQIE